MKKLVEVDGDRTGKMANNFSIYDEHYIVTEGEDPPDLNDTAFTRSYNLGTSRTFKRSILASQMDNPTLLEKIHFKPSENGEDPYTQLMKPIPVSPTEIINKMTTNRLNSKLEIFLSKNLLTPVQYQLRWQIAFDILFILRQHYPSCELYIFGSLLTGLGDPTSDIDIYFDFKGDGGRSLDKNPKTKSLAIYDVQLSISHIFESAKCRYSCNGDDDNDTNDLFASKVVMIGTRVPIVRFQHQKSQINCDISFGSRMAVHNTKLLQFYLNFDPRVRPLVVFVRYWGKKNDLLGSLKIKKYGLFLLVLVYLTKKKVVPSVNFLQELAEKQRKISGMGGQCQSKEIIEGWDVGFCEDLEMIGKYFKERCPLPEDYEERRARVMLEMAWEFMQMMGSIDFGRKVVCPLIGKCVKKDDFIDLELARVRLPGRLRKWREGWGWDERQFCRELGIFKQMVIQDPFVLDFNVACMVDVETVRRFKEACKNIF